MTALHAFLLKHHDQLMVRLALIAAFAIAFVYRKIAGPSAAQQRHTARIEAIRNATTLPAELHFYHARAAALTNLAIAACLAAAALAPATVWLWKPPTTPDQIDQATGMAVIFVPLAAGLLYLLYRLMRKFRAIGEPVVTMSTAGLGFAGQQIAWSHIERIDFRHLKVPYLVITVWRGHGVRSDTVRILLKPFSERVALHQYLLKYMARYNPAP